ncbi:hypothetical protein [Leisingera methylohalidivorans]|uniref:Uncharacterized protein n=1 Tax=Leisingera methylohalidivorans DSM 14336 TaxID=999552 RepID=V9VWP0_9RHOB|nr:hypothetical protein [Leisingera methylohalidivorans]AHD03186.1 hypothetical protein METH_16035 [Leisingera methylohalidivorans DSM 14336]
MTQDSSTPPFDEEAAASWQRFVDSISPSMHAGWMLRQTMPGTQLDAIKSLMHRNEQASAATSIKLKETKAEIEANPDDVGLEWTYDHRFWQSVFMDSAHSMSAVGMLAPFIESLFVAIFEGLRKRHGAAAEDTRHQRADDQFWNPQIVFRSEGPRDDLVAGIDQLAESCGLKPYLPADYRKTLSALFAYRNNMLHNGFEWPADAIKKFSNRIASEKWPEDWFTGADRDGQPWLYYMSPDFCSHCVELIDAVIDGVGRYLKEREA